MPATKPRSQRRQRGGKKNRKHGRNKKWCEAYRARGQEAKNRAKRQERHLRRLAKRKAKMERGPRAAS